MISKLNRATAVAQQHYDELVKLVSLDDIESGKLGTGAKRKRVEWLLEKLDQAIVEIQSLLSEKIKAEESSPLLSLPTSHASFLRERLLPSAKLIQTAHLKASGLDLLLPLLDDNYSGRGRPVWNALAFTVDYASIQLDDDDERRWEVETAEDVLHDPWFAPDRWRDNMRHLRPVLIGKTESSIPPNIRFRIAEVYRSFTFGTWMATIALCRATVEFSLIDCSQSLGFSATRKGKGGDRYLMLNDLIGLTIPKLPKLRESLVAIKKAGNRVLHPETKRNVIPIPRILRDEALDCVRAMMQVVEVLYAEQGHTVTG